MGTCNQKCAFTQQRELWVEVCSNDYNQKIGLIFVKLLLQLTSAESSEEAILIWTFNDELVDVSNRWLIASGSKYLLPVNLGEDYI